MARNCVACFSIDYFGVIFIKLVNMKLGLLEYFSYVSNSEYSRCVSEGEAVLNAGHVILCGKTKQEGSLLETVALCLQTSALSAEPHKIQGVFEINNDGVKISKFNCSCKAGNGGKCKHISAVLIYCTR
ncbi:SWIM zinc finger protein [Popillia japonica]|uniref:SWIM zinc finger protein n=1 Tax=Popillia japonica TaxID=7064 RepID=A0AAW1ITH4_POPJA